MVHFHRGRKRDAIFEIIQVFVEQRLSRILRKDSLELHEYM